MTDRLSWDNFRDVYLAGNAPAKIPLLTSPAAHLLIQPGVEIALRIGYSGSVEVRRFPRMLVVRSVRVSGRSFIEISTSQPAIFRPFFFLVLSIRELIAQDGLSPMGAVISAIEEHRQLLETDAILSEQKLIGLYGELWLLRRLIEVQGFRAVSSWIGPRKLPHDFRYGRRELEVKTTLGAERLHRIHGLAQLEASEGCDLYLVSLHTEPTGPGAGETVPEIVGAIEQLLANAPDGSPEFHRLLAASGYVEAHAQQYALRIAMRDAPKLIPIDGIFPAIRRETIAQCMQPSQAVRISDIQYTIDVSGLGIALTAKELEDVPVT